VSTVFIDFPAGAGMALARSSTQRSRPGRSKRRARTKNDVGNLVTCRYAVEEDRSGRSMSRPKPTAPVGKPSELSGTSPIEPFKKVVDNSVNAAV
jgi:hypothetical protein